tara:strand:- start:22 stop:273 length:252 start_codon:yes stop_codon:yes gene_type:complete
MEEFSNINKQHDKGEDEELLVAAINNTYEYLVSDIERSDLPNGTWLLRKPRKINTLDQLIEYFTETEEYEKCAELVKIKHTIN